MKKQFSRTIEAVERERERERESYTLVNKVFLSEHKKYIKDSNTICKLSEKDTS